MIERDTHHQFHRNTFQKISPQKFHNFIFYPTFSSISCTLIPSPSLNIYIFFNLFFFHGKHLLSFPNTYLSNPPSHSSILSQKIQGNKIIKSPLTPPPPLSNVQKTYSSNTMADPQKFSHNQMSFEPTHPDPTRDEPPGFCFKSLGS